MGLIVLKKEELSMSKIGKLLGKGVVALAGYGLANV